MLDEWQAHILRESLGERAGKWSAFEVGLIVPRQNGKGSVLEARELAGLFLFDEQLILHSAHEFKTAQEAFRRILTLVESNDALRKQVKRIRTSHGEEGIELTTGARLRFVARSTGSGRGFSGDTVILDEAYNLSADSMAALLPTLSARPNPQLWYTSSAGMETSEILARVRERGRQGGDPGLAYFEFSIDPDADLDNPSSWAQANPALGIRIPVEFVRRERAAMPEDAFARERLGVWSDPRTGEVIDPAAWEALTDGQSVPLDPVSFAVDVSPNRTVTSIALAGRRADGLMHVEVVENRGGTGWVVDRLAGMVDQWNPCALVLDPGSDAGSLLAELEARGIEVTKVTGREVGQACGAFLNAVNEKQLRHRGQGSLRDATAAARKRPLGEAWAWHRKNAAADITPLAAATQALHGYAVHGTKPTYDVLDSVM